MHKKGKKKTRKEADDEKRMDGFIGRGSFIFDKVYSSFRRNRQIKTACGV